ncbi:MAG: hypothetical protein HN403_20225, partial [Rhodospirillales bacterium]|nr:hypothetical protein [Rhodospirillales bacterium]
VPALRYVAAVPKGAVVLDTRRGEACEKQSLAGARCLSAQAFLGPHERLAGFANIAWVLGSAGLSGAESVLVVGDVPQQRDFVAGLLYLMGQSQVSVLTRGMKTTGASSGPGQGRAMVRTAVWQAQARSNTLVFKNELRDMLASQPAPVLLDGRSEKAYWGETVAAARGGHLPGADHLPADSLRADIARGRALGPAAKDAVVYGRHAVDGIAFMTLIVAGTGTPVRAYPGGWAEWASDGGLPADAETFPIPVRPSARKGG